MQFGKTAVNRKRPRFKRIRAFKKKTSATTYSSTSGSTIGAKGLNFSVRNGKRWTPFARVTEIKMVVTETLIKRLAISYLM
jgi:hypothetical protein